MAIERFEIAPQKCLYVDDSVACLAAAEEAGMDTLLIRHPGNVLGLDGVSEWNGSKITKLNGVLGYINS